MKRFWLSITAALLIAAVMTPAYAWEFSMTGEFVYRMQYFSRTGTRDIFGDANMQEAGLVNSNSVAVPTFDAARGLNATTDSAPATWGTRDGWIGFAGPNIYLTGWMNPLILNTNPAGGGPYPTFNAGDPLTNYGNPHFADAAGSAGVAITRGGFSRWGSEAFYSDQRLTMHPAIRVNNAIRVHGVYTVGGLRHKYAQRGWDAWGSPAPGIPPFERYYMHHSSEAAYNTAAIGSWEQLRATIQLPVATLSIGIKDFPFGSGSFFANNIRTDSFLAVVPYGPFRFLFAIWPGRPFSAGFTSFDTVPDVNTKFNWNIGPLVTWESGPLWLGGGAILGAGHFDYAYGALNPTIGRGYDHNSTLWAAGLKFFNGRFFLNVDWSMLNNDYYRIKRTNDSVLGNRPRYEEGNTFFAEAGVVTGPAKVSLMYALSSGPVLNNNNPTKVYSVKPINYQVLEPYSYLMFPIYGGGNNRFNNDGTGEMGDAFAFGGRLDYAVAANLNVWGTYLWAHRLETAGTYAGQYYATSNIPVGGVLNSPQNATAAGARAFKEGNGDGTGGSVWTNPYVDDGLIGWEAQLGVDWKLLEGLNMGVAYSYWNLGPWFDQAYRAFIGNTAAGISGNGLMQGRDAIHSLRGNFTINF